MANSLAAHVVLLLSNRPFCVNRLARSNMKTLFTYYPQEDIFGVGPDKSAGIKRQSWALRGLENRRYMGSPVARTFFERPFCGEAKNRALRVGRTLKKFRYRQAPWSQLFAEGSFRSYGNTGQRGCHEGFLELDVH